MGRVVIVDPGYASSVGHHADVNAQLQEALTQRGWAAECWGDVGMSGVSCRGVFHGCGYVDPRHWSDLGGTVHLGKRLERQLLDNLKGQANEDLPAVTGWVMHTALPFQLLGLARALRHVPAATVLMSLMFPPGETLGGDGGVEGAITNCRVALNAFSQAVERGKHCLRLELPSQQALEMYGPLLEAAGLSCSGLHPAVVGAGIEVPTPTAERAVSDRARPRILLHWGDLKPGKGRREALEVVRQLLRGDPLPAPLQQAEWLFHLHSHEALPAVEQSSLERAEREVPRFRWLKERVGAEEMQALLSGCGVALLAYDPVLYQKRSSGLLWCYGASRLMSEQPAAVVGQAGGWLEREALDLGMRWRSGASGGWIDDLGSMVSQGPTGCGSPKQRFTTYAQRILGRGFAGHVVEVLQEAGHT